jgi:Heliorhodopsin
MLSTINLTASILHFLLAIGFGSYFLYLNNKYPNSPVQGIETSVRRHELNYTGLDAVNATITRTWVSTEQSVFAIENIQILLVSFFLITGCFHLFYYFTNKEDGIYTKVIKNKNNYFRWIEYSITSTMMLYIIAFSSGVKDMEVYTLLFATNVSMIAQGQLIEVAVRDGGDWVTPMVTGFLLLIAEFICVFRALSKRFSEIDNYISSHPIASNGFKVPQWLSYLGIIIFILFSCFGLISLYGAYSKTSYENVESLYIIFSFIAKASLGFFMSFGLSQRQANQSIVTNPN